MINIFDHNNLIVNLVIAFLILASCLSWYLIFYKALKLKREYSFYQQFSLKNIDSTKWLSEIEKIANSSLKQGAVQLILQKFVTLKPQLISQQSSDSKKELLTMHLAQTLDDIRSWLDSGLAILASIGSLAPFIGLFGTVIGIYDALQSIASQGNAGLNVVSAPISEALIVTAIGLFVAIPAVLAYNSFVRLNKILMQNLKHLAEKIAFYATVNNQIN